MPREFLHTIVVCVYVPPQALIDTACDKARLQTQHLEAFIAISGDFNYVTCLNSTFFYQFVDCPTRTFDLLYANIWDSYSATLLPQLGKSNYNLVLLQPQFKPSGADEALGHCFESSDYSVLQEPRGEDIEGVTHCISDYLNFCMDVVVLTVCCFANNKRWFTSDVKDLLNEKRGHSGRGTGQS